MSAEHKIPLKRALFYVLISVLVIWGTFFITWLVHRTLLLKRKNDPRYKIVALVQATDSREHLSCNQLAEILDLSIDRPQNLYAFDTSLACKKLLSCPVIKKASCHRQRPGIVHVDYRMREPKAQLGDFVNVAIDDEGRAFPLTPYFTPKRLPEMVLGLSAISYERPFESYESLLAIKIIDYVQAHFPKGSRLVKVDTANALSQQAGKREVVLVLEQQPGNMARFVRIDSKNVEQVLEHFLAMQPALEGLQQDKPLMVDLRCPNLALVKPV